MLASDARYGARLEGFDYPHPVQIHAFESQRQALEMAYLDVAPTAPANGRTVLLLHGKNFCAATWESAIGALTAAGYRVVAPDQIGFCKSGKPERYQYSFAQLAGNTHALLQSLGIRSVMLIPLQAPSGTLGVLTFVKSSDARTFSEADVSFASELGRRSAAGAQG